MTSFTKDGSSGQFAERAFSDHPRGEIISPTGEHIAIPAYQPAEPPQRRERSGWNPMGSPATYALTGINLAVFVLMVAHHVSPTSPGSDDLVRWGANLGWADYSGSTMNGLFRGQLWRLVTATFEHVGALHLATNMWCLWNLGLLGEPLLGPWGLVATYILTGVAGNLLSTAMHPTIVGAGASGAVFGIAGILIVLLSNKSLPIPWPELKKLRRSVIWFAILNLVLGVGLGSGLLNSIRIDNFAHIGGCFCGLALGVPLLPRMTAGRVKYLARQKVVFPVAALILALAGYWLSSFTAGVDPTKLMR
jgi:rhomboid protease GluP